MIWLVLLAIVISVTRFFVPTVGHSWSMVFIAFSHIYVGALLVLLWQKPKWWIGWVCLAVPTAIETMLFFAR